MLRTSAVLAMPADPDSHGNESHALGRDWWGPFPSKKTANPIVEHYVDHGRDSTICLCDDSYFCVADAKHAERKHATRHGEAHVTKCCCAHQEGVVTPKSSQEHAFLFL